MKKSIKIFTLLLSFTALTQIELQARRSHGSHIVKGIVRKDGTYVRRHYKTNPSRDRYKDNWSSQGNVNPHTGQPGTHPRYDYRTR